FVTRPSLAPAHKTLAQRNKPQRAVDAIKAANPSVVSRTGAAMSRQIVLSKDEFLGLIKAAGSDFYPPDDEQAKAVYADSRADLFIVAGPGTGKTSCLSFRALYLVFVAGLSPRSIMATTFTKKAAAELRSRVLGWGYRMIDAAEKASLPQNKVDF